MRMKSTGLGKTELVGDFNDITHIGDYLVLHVKTKEPVKWHVRAAVNINDVSTIIKLLLRPSNLFFLLKHLFRKSESRPPGEY